MKENSKINKHLTYEDRKYIEIGLNQGRSFVEIADDLSKSRKTIFREVLKHRFKKTPSSFNGSGNLCSKKIECKKFDCTKELKCYVEQLCLDLAVSPYVCNRCDKKGKCREIKYYYYAKFAYDEYRDTLLNSRQGINLSKSEAYDIDKLIAPLIKDKNQSINHIYANHPDELPFSKPTMYTYINLGVFSFRNIDLPRKVKYRKRKDSKSQKIRRETAIRKNRAYEDFKEYISKNPEASVVEMDTVEGVKGGKVLLTLLFRNSKFMLVYLMNNKTMECVGNIFTQLKSLLGIKLFKKLFEVILTDNGSEFFNSMSIEKFSETDEIVSHIFYCNPSASWQKGAIEKNHEYIRYVLPKGTTFNELTQQDVNILVSHINSTSRDILNGKTPYDAMLLLTDEDIINKLDIKKIIPDEVNLSTKLLKAGDK